MTVRSQICLALTWVGVIGCQTELADAPANKQDEAAPTSPTKSPREKIALDCRTGDDIADEEREAIVSDARASLELVRRAEYDNVWTALHPQARHEDGRAPFMEALEGMNARLQDATGDVEVDAAHHIAVTGGINDVARVLCGEGPDDPHAFTMMANVGGEDLAVVSLRAPGDVFEFLATVELRRRGKAWRLVGLQVNPAVYLGKSSSDFESAGDELLRSDKTLAAYLAFGVAQTLSTRGASMKTASRERIEGKLKAINRDQLVGAWSIGGKRFEVHGVSLASTRSDISPVIKYVSPGGLVTEILEKEADQLMAHVRSNYAELAEHFPAVVFEAYAEKPTIKGKPYDAYRVARLFKPTKAD